MWLTEHAHRLARQPLRWAGDTDPGTCERCGAEGATPFHLFNTCAWTYDLCATCQWNLGWRRLLALREACAWEMQARAWGEYLWR